MYRYVFWVLWGDRTHCGLGWTTRGVCVCMCVCGLGWTTRGVCVCMCVCGLGWTTRGVCVYSRLYHIHYSYTTCIYILYLEISMLLYVHDLYRYPWIFLDTILLSSTDPSTVPRVQGPSESVSSLSPCTHSGRGLHQHHTNTSVSLWLSLHDHHPSTSYVLWSTRGHLEVLLYFLYL